MIGYPNSRNVSSKKCKRQLRIPTSCRYLGRLPTDPFTGSNQTWQESKEAAPLSPKQTSLGIVDVHSGSDELSLNGTPYSRW
jgi:general secretion pathway protein G